VFGEGERFVEQNGKKMTDQQLNKKRETFPTLRGIA
jgi:hypothetical protein